MQVEEKENKNKEKDLDKNQNNIVKDMMIAIDEKIVNKKIVVLDRKIEKKENIIEIVKKEITTKIEVIRSQKSIRKNTKKTDQDQNKEIIQHSIEIKIKLVNIIQIYCFVYMIFIY